MTDANAAFADPSEDWSNGVISSAEYKAMLTDLQKYNLLQETKDGHYKYSSTFFQDIEKIVAANRSINSEAEAVIMRYCQAGVNTNTKIEVVPSTALNNHILSGQYDENTQKNVCVCASQVSNHIITRITQLSPRFCEHKEYSTSAALIHVDEDEAGEDEKKAGLKS